MYLLKRHQLFLLFPPTPCKQCVWCVCVCVGSSNQTLQKYFSKNVFENDGFATKKRLFCCLRPQVDLRPSSLQSHGVGLLCFLVFFGKVTQVSVYIHICFLFWVTQLPPWLEAPSPQSPGMDSIIKTWSTVYYKVYCSQWTVCIFSLKSMLSSKFHPRCPCV